MQDLKSYSQQSTMRNNGPPEVLPSESIRQTAIQRVLLKTSFMEGGDTTRILTIALQELVATIEADVALLGLFSKQSEALHPSVVHGITEYATQIELKGDSGLLDTVTKDQKSRCWSYGGPGGSILEQTFGCVKLQSEITTPLVFKGLTIGLLVLGCSSESTFDESTISFVETFMSAVANNVQVHQFFVAALKLGTVRFDEMSERRICAILAEKASDIMATPVTCVWLRHDLHGEETLVLRGVHGTEILDQSAFSIKRSEGGLSWKALLAAERLIEMKSSDTSYTNTLHEVHEDIHVLGLELRHPEFAGEHSLRSMIIMPIVLGTQILGVIDTFACRRYQFFDREIYLLQNLALSGAMALGTAGLTQRLSEINEAILDMAQLANPGAVALSFSHDISHTMSHVNALLSSLIDLVPKRLQEDSPGKDIIESLTASTDYLRQLFRSLVKYAGGKPVRYTPASLKEILDYVHYFYSVRLQANRIEFPKPVLEGGDIWIECDRAQIEQVFINLFSNSIYAIKRRMSKGGRITVSARSLNEEVVEIQFKDNGIGIAPDDLARIFDPFFTTKGYEGSGFGLPICRKIVEDNHCGKIWIKSQPQDHTIVFISLPKRRH